MAQLKTITQYSLICTVVFMSMIASVWGQLGFQTMHGQGPDKWATVWLIRTFIEPLPVDIIADSHSASSATQFDMPGATLDRTGSSTTYSAFLKQYQIKDPVALMLGDIVHDIEINAWNPDQQVLTQLIENAFRQMQLRLGRSVVTQTCYFEFFNRVASKLADQTLSINTNTNTLIPDSACVGNAASSPQELNDDANVPEMNINDVLKSIASRERIIFLDTREAREFREGHIPGAVNLTLRKLNTSSTQVLTGADRVIAYCVKDFRGYEAARKLRGMGINAAIMNPYGIKGWHTAGLPVAGSKALPEYEAAEQLLHIAENNAAKRTTPLNAD